LVDGLTKDDRIQLTRFGLRIGPLVVQVTGLGSPEAVRLRAVLWAVYHAHDGVPPIPLPGTVSITPTLDWPDGYFEAIGFVRSGMGFIRVDRLERLALMARKRSAQGPFAVTPEMARLVGCKPHELGPILGNLGYASIDSEEGPMFSAVRVSRRTIRKRRANRTGASVDTNAGPSKDNGAFKAQATQRPGAPHRSSRSKRYDPNSPFAKLKELKIAR
jgi:ATP-dependent RNA helicase SUPV3L1/SUV3